ncbi:multidrug resistance efflux pump acriflavin resistance protein [Komagataeibacter xylinus NBRC 13693]|uniref:Multidrug resistance efflux pump acriflavin resistance protein n=1 Tax=Komagataeibacter xylinus NBRC 13693 TaxID=1234668 RepID=A0A0D6Q4S9_KOMXY|nr:efflux RND transporter permease subunit [Komagataeibacter xylinus]GAN98572.1 multidrug resistance efflux pump acriflavin resistance protein [Komagataeibacter xylinus NBRC 13693]
MNICRPFILRPVGTVLMAMALLFAGVVGYRAMPVADMPNFSVPVIYVIASQPGSSPQQMASSVTTPLERRLGTIAGLRTIQSDSNDGFAFLLMFFDDTRNIDGAARDVEAAIQAARADMPPTLRITPQYYKANPASMPVMIASLTSPTRPLYQLRDMAETRLLPMLSQIHGVGWVQVAGTAKPAVRVDVQPWMLYKFGIGYEDVRAALASANANTPKGVIETGDRRFTLATNDQARNAAQYRDLVIAYRSGRPVRLADVAHVEDGPENERRAGWANDDPAVVAIIRPQPGANVIAITDQIKARTHLLQQAMPADVRLTFTCDRSLTIRAALLDTQFTLFFAIVLVTVVVLAFLQSWRSTVIPVITVPISLAGAVAGMYLMGFSLDTLSLMALTIATGFIVDDAIVVVENIVRHMEAGASRMQATLAGAEEIAFTIVAITVSLVAVFLPMLFMGGTPGKILFEFAMTLVLAVSVSLLLSLSLTPMMGAHLLHRHAPARGDRWRDRLGQALDRGFVRCTAWYGGSLDYALRHRWLVILSLPLTLVGSVIIMAHIPKTMIPAQDISIMQGYARADQNISFQAMSARTREVVRRLRADPDIRDVIALTGEEATNQSQFFIQLVDRDQRHSTPDEISQRLRASLRTIGGIQVNLSNAGDMNGGGGRQHDGNYSYVLHSDNADDVYTWVPRLADALRQEPDLMGVTTRVEDNADSLMVDIARDTAARYLITPQLISNSLYDAYGERTASNISTPFTAYHVVMETAARYRENPDIVHDMWISTAGGSAGGGTVSNTIRVTRTDAASLTGLAAISQQSFRNSIANRLAGGAGASSGSAVSSSTETMIPLSNVTYLRRQGTPLSISHQGGAIAGTISFDLAPGRSLSQAEEAIQRSMLRLHIPSGVHGAFVGESADFHAAIVNQVLAFLSAIVVMYITLGILYESYSQPLTIISTLPSAMLGATGSLWLCGQAFSLVGMIGVIMLVGMAAKNSILVVDFALRAQREGGLPVATAIEMACVKRFRPILMTTLAAAMGAVPLVLGNSYGVEMRRPLGIAILGGLVVCQVMTLYSTPVVYLVMDQCARRFRRKG